ncbi:MAG: class I SAM-dependent methyltransferase [candidate division NC10 bacterium]|nr:class I SAM-dependent methyltransferase [candidate division NC10 bacterium]
MAGKPRVLDVGCGRRKRSGTVGIDVNPDTAADIVSDLDRFPWPLADNSFDLILCHHVIEHLGSIVQAMEELHRIGRPGAVVEIITPHFSSLYSWQDPTHRHHLALDSFDYFTENTRHTNFYTSKRFRVLEKRLHFGASVFSVFPRLLYALSSRWYERHAAFMFPANDLFFRIEVVKEGDA